jgi:hypothetical protein
MARQRRGGLRPPELRGTLGTLLRTAVPAVRDVLERGAREGRARLDDALSGRRRTDALAELGEIVLDLIRRGEIDIAELPEIQDIVAHLDHLDADEEPPPPPPRTSVRKRFDDRARDFDPKRTIDQRPRGRRDNNNDEGTVSSRTWSPPKPAQPARVWRPSQPQPESPRPADEITARERPATPKKGGISFDNDDDSDLADYMHPDDVPPKSKDES